ncbi:hypothetical protein SAMN05414138_1026 [Rhodoplanes sp. JGI PP 4-B12]|uniref:hypothetical protein n=1 Tax=Rhodoplanes sp. JGI PP 4-B12 TaxID=1873883 RepID=UPI000B505659|nr:hypothetical protein [Rhodoplanes sp. JGI PP 4-B12]SNB53870.1 hypothetical protein SAMN05414138_1026 [Rhodoplanes sp. JGI PP 4-B12]
MSNLKVDNQPGDNPDAELLVFGEALERLWPQFQAAIAAKNKSQGAVCDRFYALDRQTCELAKKIMASPVHTLTGLRVKAMVAIHAPCDCWDKPFDDLDWDKKGIRALVEAVCSVTGLEPPKEKQSA